MVMIDGFPEFLPLALAAALAGSIRGFSGFGAALMFTPLASMFVEPWRAVLLLFLIDGLMSLPLVPGALRQCNWREVVPLTAGATITVPVGVYFLVSVDPVALRWTLSGLALGAVAVLSSGWRYQAQPGPAVSGGVGAISGLLGGLAGFYGPPMVIFWLGGRNATATVRANIIVFFAAMTVVAGATYAFYGVFKISVVQQALYLMPAYGLALWIGAHLFRRASENLFRWIAYAVIAGVAASSSPAFDGNNN